jgi:hypothetical protein
MSQHYYVYILIDPSDMMPFYVGKGTKQRWKKHFKETKETTENMLKWCKIQSIRNKNLEPLIEFDFRTNNEMEAYDYEALLIKIYGRKHIDINGILTNRCSDNRPPNQKGRPKSDNQKYKMSQSRKRFFLEHPEAIENLRNKSKNKTKEFRENSRQRLLDRPMNDGIPENNPRALDWIFIDPTGKKYKVKGRREHFCIEHNLSLSTFVKTEKTGIQPTSGKNVGWILSKAS